MYEAVLFLQFVGEALCCSNVITLLKNEAEGLGSEEVCVCVYLCVCVCVCVCECVNVLRPTLTDRQTHIETHTH